MISNFKVLLIATALVSTSVFAGGKKTTRKMTSPQPEIFVLSVTHSDKISKFELIHSGTLVEVNFMNNEGFNKKTSIKDTDYKYLKSKLASLKVNVALSPHCERRQIQLIAGVAGKPKSYIGCLGEQKDNGKALTEIANLLSTSI
jgi:hypothetical protein